MSDWIEFLVRIAPTLGAGSFVLFGIAIYAYQADIVVSGVRYREHLADCHREYVRERERSERLLRHAITGAATAERAASLLEALRDE